MNMDFCQVLADVRFYAKEVRTPELRKKAVNELLQAMTNGLPLHLSLLDGRDSLDELARFFMFKKDEHNAFMADVLDDVLNIYVAEKGDHNIRKKLINALHRSTYKNMDGVERAIRFLRGETLGVFYRERVAA